MTKSETRLRPPPAFDLGTLQVPDQLPLSTRMAVALAAVGIVIAAIIAFTAGLVVVAILFVVVTVARLIARLGGRRRPTRTSACFDDVRYIDLRIPKESDPSLN